jgi:hypothetical protein
VANLNLVAGAKVQTAAGVDKLPTDTLKTGDKIIMGDTTVIVVVPNDLGTGMPITDLVAILRDINGGTKLTDLMNAAAGLTAESDITAKLLKLVAILRLI